MVAAVLGAGLPIGGGCDNGAGPTLGPLSAQQVRVNEELRMEIAIDNPGGVPVEVSVEENEIVGFDRVHTVTSTPTGAVFRWAPLSSQVGPHELTFILAGAGGGGEFDRATVMVDVVPAADAAPVFIQPDGAGGTFDVERGCVMFDVEVRDDDSATVDLGTRGELPSGATLASGGPKRATFDWCPQPDQIAAQERWTIQLYADDGDHPQVNLDWIVVLRSGPKDGCPGAAPTITIGAPRADEAITSGTTYNVTATVTDDMALRDPPLLYFTTTEPTDLTNPNVAEFEEFRVFEPTSGDEFVGRIPNLGLAEGEMQRVWYFISATDNDDPEGSTCDHRTDSPVTAFFAVGGVPPDGTLQRCDFCSGQLGVRIGDPRGGTGGRPLHGRVP